VRRLGGLPGLRLVGLPDAAVREAGERVRAALQRSGFQWPPLRIVVNLAPADLPKVGTGFDLPLALAVLAASGQVDVRGLATSSSTARSGSTGRSAVSPACSPSRSARERLGAPRLLVPEEGAAVTSAVTGLEVWPARDLVEAVALVDGVASARPVADRPGAARPVRSRWRPRGRPGPAGRDGARSRSRPREGTTSCSSVHPGVGSRCSPGGSRRCCPTSTVPQQLEVATVHGVAGGPCAVPSPRPPVRAPQAGITAAALVGGGAGAGRPGELSLAHRGVLVLDELLETPRPVLDALRQPLEEGRVVIDRARVRVVLPARVQLVATTNPCPCGMLGHPRRSCTCRPDRIQRYRSRLSGPLFDRIDVHVAMLPVPRERLTGPSDGESSATVAARVARARLHARERQGLVLNRDVAWEVVHRTTDATAAAAARRRSRRRSGRPRERTTAASGSRAPSPTSRARGT
jgi:magnesium chelatase family protein